MAAATAARIASKLTKKSKIPIVDVHTHLYPPFYIDLLRSRDTVPYIKPFPPGNQLRLVNRTADNGRPMVPHFYDVKTKLAFMDTHGIDISILSLGNPWLDFLPSNTAGDIAQNINDGTNDMCASNSGRLYFFAALPLSAPMPIILDEIKRLATLSHVRGIVLGTNGMGPGLDDPNLLPLFKALAEAHLPIFLHPHYGLPAEVYGTRRQEHGQILPLGLGFPMETTIALTRMILSGVFDEVPGLQIIVSHAGGTLPFLAGRIESCIDHDRLWYSQGKLKAPRKTVWDVLRKNIYLDGVIYDKIGMKTAIDASGADRVMFGTDHPFFPPLDGRATWPSFTLNEKAVKDTFGSSEEYDLIMGGNAVRVLNL